MLDVRTTDSELEVRGALDDHGGRELLRVIASIHGDVRIDASGVQRIDGAGLTALAIARRRCLDDGRAFVLTAVAPEAVRGLRVANRLADLFGAPQSSAASEEAVSEARATGAALDGASGPEVPRRRFRLALHRPLHRHQGM